MQELQDNSSQLNRLESEAYCMKDTLNKLQASMQEELDTHQEVAMTTATMTTNLDQNSNSK